MFNRREWIVLLAYELGLAALFVASILHPQFAAVGRSLVIANVHGSLAICWPNWNIRPHSPFWGERWAEITKSHMERMTFWVRREWGVLPICRYRVTWVVPEIGVLDFPTRTRFFRDIVDRENYIRLPYGLLAIAAAPWIARRWWKHRRRSDDACKGCGYGPVHQ